MRVLCAVLGAAFFLLPAKLGWADFPGWEGYRVIQQDGRPYVIRAADIDRDGRDELIVVNGRFSRLDIYRWTDGAAEDEEVRPQADQPNELPMARELTRDEIQLEHVPHDVVIEDLDFDGQPELIVLVAPPGRVVVYASGTDQKWTPDFHIDLLDGEFATRRNSLLVRRTSETSLEALVSCKKGIQRLPLQRGGRSDWMSPRERQRRTAWWLADLNGDGNVDLIEQGIDADEAVRWYRCTEQSRLAPAEVLFDRAVQDMEVLRGQSAAQVLLLDGAVKDLLRRYRLARGPRNRLGQQRPLALSGGNRAAWCGLEVGEELALVVADPDRPRLLSYVLHDEGWQPERAYPATSEIRALAAPEAVPGTLLIWTKDAADLEISRWQAGRLTYPRKWNDRQTDDDRTIVALSQVGKSTWWAQREGEQLHFHLWESDGAAPRAISFDNVGSKVEQVLWIGGERLLIQESRSRAIKLVANEDGKTVVRSPSHLKRASIADFRITEIAGEIRLARLLDGVWQWIGEDLRSQDQIMLPQGLELAAYVAEDARSGWALQQNSPYIHRLEADETGVFQSLNRTKVGRGDDLIMDPILGLLLLSHNRITQLSAGEPYELQLIDTADQRIGRSRGIRKTNLHRLASVDLDGDGQDELVMFDDLEHRLTVASCDAGHIAPLISWPVFDDKIYPYSDDTSSVVREPRSLVGLDIDGDGAQDLAMICHDRLIIYLANETP